MPQHLGDVKLASQSILMLLLLLLCIIIIIHRLLLFNILSLTFLFLTSKKNDRVIYKTFFRYFILFWPFFINFVLCNAYNKKKKKLFNYYYLFLTFLEIYLNSLEWLYYYCYISKCRNFIIDLCMEALIFGMRFWQVNSSVQYRGLKLYST